MRKVLRYGVAAAVLGLGAWAYAAYADEIKFYLRIARAYVASRRFYARYPHLARDVAFDPALQPRLDVYSPPAGSGHPVLVFVHGGSWKDYGRRLFAAVAMKLVPHGLVVVIPDYTLYPRAGYEQMARESAAALSWTLDNVERYGGDPRRVVMSGHSAGAHLALLAVMDPRFLAAHGKEAGQVRGLLGMSGVYDVQGEYDYWVEKGFTPTILSEVMGGPGNFRAASPVSHVRAGLPPVLLLHGDQDQTVPADQALRLHAALQAAESPVALKLYAGAGHSDFLFEALDGDRAGVVATVAQFVRGE